MNPERQIRVIKRDQAPTSSEVPVSIEHEKREEQKVKKEAAIGVKKWVAEYRLGRENPYRGVDALFKK
jgi:hypothetical protein